MRSLGKGRGEWCVRREDLAERGREDERGRRERKGRQEVRRKERVNERGSMKISGAQRRGKEEGK